MSIVPHHIQAQYMRDAHEAQQRGITPEQLRAERKQKEADKAKRKEERKVIAKGVVKMAELASKQGELRHFAFYMTTDGDFCLEANAEDVDPPDFFDFRGNTPFDCFRQLLEHFK